jgi:dipeptidyl aminopeptidase/acylaminoacyl peptidase
MFGVSRGGMMTYLALKAGLHVRAAATVGAPADLAVSLTHRPEMEEVYRQLMPDYATQKAEHLRARSAVHWAGAISAPLLMLHGGADWRVWPGNSLSLASKLQALGRPYGLVIYEGDDHPLTRNWPDARTRIREWFRRH